MWCCVCVVVCIIYIYIYLLCVCVCVCVCIYIYLSIYIFSVSCLNTLLLHWLFILAVCSFFSSFFLLSSSSSPIVSSPPLFPHNPPLDPPSHSFSIFTVCSFYSHFFLPFWLFPRFLSFVCSLIHVFFFHFFAPACLPFSVSSIILFSPFPSSPAWANPKWASVGESVGETLAHSFCSPDVTDWPGAKTRADSEQVVYSLTEWTGPFLKNTTGDIRRTEATWMAMLIPHLYSSQVKSRCSRSASSNNKPWLLRQKPH